jgi:hypothetical protein
MMAALWKSAASQEAEVQRLASLAAAEHLLYCFVQAGPDIIEEWQLAREAREMALRSGEAAPGPAPHGGEEPEAAPGPARQDGEVPEAAPSPARQDGEVPEAAPGPKPRVRKPCDRPRIHAPTLLALAMRSAELLTRVTKQVFALKIELIRKGIDPGPIIQHHAALVVARVFKDELKLDLNNLAYCGINDVFAALARVKQWIDEAEASRHEPLVPPKEPPPPVEAGPRQADPPLAQEAQPEDSEQELRARLLEELTSKLTKR